MNVEDYRAQHEREGRQYREAVDRLPPDLKAEWAEVEASYEYFDGEWWAALGVFADWLKRRSTHDATGPIVRDDRLVCSTCFKPAWINSSFDGDSAWAEHGDIRAVAR